MRVLCLCKHILVMSLVIGFAKAEQYQLVEAIGGLYLDQAEEIIQTSDNGYALAGYTDSYGAGGLDMILSRFDSLGMHVWTRALGGSEDDQGRSLVQTYDGGFLLAGRTMSFGAGEWDIMLAKFDASGNFLWAKTVGGSARDFIYQIIQTTDRGLAIAGHTWSFGPSEGEVFVVKMDSLGNFLWATTMGWDYGLYPSSEDGEAIVQTSDGGYAVAGCSWSFGSNDQALILCRLDASGNHLWSRNWGAEMAGVADSPDRGYSLVETPDSGLVLAGATVRFSAGGSSDLILCKFDSTGTHLWTRTWGGAGNEEGFSMILTLDNGFAVTGYTESYGAGSKDIILSRFDASGNHLWSRTIGGTDSDWAYSVALAHDNGFAIGGYTKSFDVDSLDMILVKCDSTGVTCIGDLVTPTVGSPSPVVHTDNPDVTHPTPTVQTQTPDVASVTPDVHVICYTDVFPPSRFGLISPPDSAILTVARPTFVWEPSFDLLSGLQNYEVYINDTLRHTSEDTTWTADYDLNDGYYDWHIVAYDSAGNSQQSNQIWTVYIGVFRILSIQDIPNDQGRQVRVTWFRSRYDDVGTDSLVTEYSLWRRVDPTLETFSLGETNSPLETPPGDWDFIATIPAVQDSTYNYVAPTLADSTMDDGMYYSVFFVRAHTANPSIHWETLPDSGYSVDNLAPSPPSGLSGQADDGVVELWWEPCPDSDFDYFAIYRDTISGFDPTQPLAYTIDTAYTDTTVETGKTYYYRVSAFDFSGNQSEFSEEIGVTTGILEYWIGTVPRTFSLSQNYPNPFKPTTQIQYSVPMKEKVSIKIYNQTGQLVRVLVDEIKTPGTYEVEWDGRDDTGEEIAGGSYFYRLTIEDRVLTKKMIVFK